MLIQNIIHNESMSYKWPIMRIELPDSESVNLHIDEISAVVADGDIIKSYLFNEFTEAIYIVGDLITQFPEIFNFIAKLRNDFYCDDDVIVFTEYRETELNSVLDALRMFRNIIVVFEDRSAIKYSLAHYDDILGVYIPDNQYARRIS